MMGLQGVGITGEVEVFQKPIFQTFGMFVGMTFALVMHMVVQYFGIPFPGYERKQIVSQQTKPIGLRQEQTTGYGSIAAAADETNPLMAGSKSGGSSTATTATSSDNKSLPLSMYFLLAIPSIFDLGATALCMMGLQYIDVSIYQLLRGSGEYLSLIHI